jgi:hypothetical protein
VFRAFSKEDFVAAAFRINLLVWVFVAFGDRPLRGGIA